MSGSFSFDDVISLCVALLWLSVNANVRARVQALWGGKYLKNFENYAEIYVGYPKRHVQFYKIEYMIVYNVRIYSRLRNAKYFWGELESTALILKKL